MDRLRILVVFLVPRLTASMRGRLVATDAVAVAPTARFANGRDLLGQPRGLFFIGATELWERISFHGMQALLVLYMVEQLLLPGHVENIVGFTGFRAAIEGVTGPLSSQALASQIFGLYVGFVYLVPVFGGLLGDRVLGRRRAVALGAVLMTAGHFCMAFEASFLAALLLLILGAGLLRGNLASQVGDLYSDDDRRRETAFQIYYGALNSGAFVAPLITGVLAQTYGWHYGLGFAGFGMLLGLLVYLSGARDLPPDAVRGASAVRAGLGFSDRSLSGGTAIFSANRRSSTDETTQTQPLTGLQGPSGFGRHQGREDAGAASGAL